MREEQRRAQEAREREVKALEERRRAVQAQWGKATREECVEGKEKETNQVHEEDDWYSLVVG